MKPLSEKLAQLSVEAKSTEDRVAKAQSEAREHIEQKREQARAQAEQALAKVSEHVSQVKDEARTQANTLQTKVKADFEDMKQDASVKRDQFKSWQANNYANDKEADAAAAIDYAIAATKLAEVQTLDAIAARAEAVSRSEQVEAEHPTVA